jgi:PAS domain S-box-containing protein
MDVDLSRVLDGLPAMVWTAVPDGKIDFVNQRWSEYTGLSLVDANGWNWLSVIKTDDLACLLERWKSILASGQPGEMEARIRRCDGRYRWFFVQTNPIRDDEERIIKWCGVSIDVDDRKRAEDDLRTSERDARQILESIPGMVAIFTPQGELESVNQQVLEYFGKTLDELRNWGTTDAVHPEDLPRCVEAFSNAIASGDPFELECRARRFDGVYRWFQSRGSPLRDSNGRVLFWNNLLIDIDERKRTEEALRESEYKLRQIIEAVPGVIWSAAPTGRLTYVNRRLLDYSGLQFEEFMQRGWEEAYMHSADMPDATERYRRAIETGTSYQVVLRLRRADGEFRWHRTLCEPLRDREGRIIQWYGLSIDVDEAKKAEDQLRRSEAFMAEGQRLSLTGTLSWRVDTDEIRWSEELYRIFEFEPGTRVTLELIGSRVHPDDIPMLIDMIERARSHGDDFEYEHRLQMPDGSVKYLHLVAHATRDEGGRLEYIGACQDVTQRRLSEEALVKARSDLAHVARVTSLGALTASIAHEVSQPLSGIITNASTGLRMLSADPPNVEGARETVRRTLRDGNRASDVIVRLRALFGRKATTMERVDLNEVTREVIALSSSELQKNRVIARLEFADDLPQVQGDRVQLQQVVLNLTRNASDAMAGRDDGPNVMVISTKRVEDNRAQLSVRDTGHGFDPEAAGRLFEAFYTTKADGMGIGLAVSRSIIEGHRGSLWAGPNDGPGATFSFAVPGIAEEPKA